MLGRMRYRFLTLAAGMMMLIGNSCTKVIDLDLNNAGKKYVIEAVMADAAGTAKVMITQTKDFDQDNDFPGVSGAVVSITENGGLTTPLTETAPGVYEEALLVGHPGKTYTLSVKVGGKEITAVSTIPVLVNLDSLFVTDEFLFTDTRKIVNAVYKDPAGRGNNYRFIQYVNDKKEKQILILNDDYTDGRTVTSKLFYFSDDEDDKGIKSGDVVKIEMFCIDANMYRYWFSLDRSSTGGSGEATPSNPVTNLQGDALGYFSAHTFQRRTLVVP
jgi:Domain of unknown function (DUF4249)